MYNKTNDFFAKLPNNTVWCIDDGISLKKELKYPFTVSVLYHLYENTNLKGYTMFSINELIVSCGYIPLKGSISKFKDLLQKLLKKNIISELSIPLKEVKQNQFIKCKLNLLVESNFFIVYDRQFRTIMDSDYDATVKNNTFTVLSYIISRIRSTSIDDNTDIGYCYFGYEKAVFDLGLAEDTIRNCCSIAKELGLLYYDNVGYIKFPKKQCSNIYSLTKKGLEFGLKYSYEYYDTMYVDNFIPKKRE